MSSPSRPASAALMITSMSSERMSLWIALSCFSAFASFGVSLNFSGTIGRSA